MEKKKCSAAATAAVPASRPGLSVSTYIYPSWGLAAQTRLLPQVATDIYITKHTIEKWSLTFSYSAGWTNIGCCFTV